MTRINAFVGYASILVICFGLALAARLDSVHNYAVAKQHFVESAHADAVSAATQVQGKLRAIYENLRTLTFLPSVQNIERHGANLGDEGRTTIQQVYNNLASSVSVSEVYIVPASFNPERIDPQTGKTEEPILMFDELIVNAASRLPKSDARELPVPKNASAEEIEIYEYRQLKQQIAWLNQKYPSASYISGLEVPIISGPEIITCDNNKYIHTGRDADRSGVMFSIPFFDKVGLLKGTVTAIILTDALRKMLPSQDFALINHGYGYVAPSSGSGQEQSSASWVAQNKPDPGLIYSEVLPLSLNDPQSAWKIWAGRPNQSFYDGAEVKAVHAAEYAFYAVIAILLLAATVCWWLIVRSMRLAASARSQLEQRVDERTREIGYLATHDVLTGLPNRAQLRDKLTEALACLGDDERLAVLYVDLDRFKQVNDTLGHAIGDELLKAMVARVKNCIRPTDIVARLGGDEFVVVQRRLASVDDAERLAKDVIEAAGRSFDLDGHHVVVGASIGIAIAPADGGTAELLLKNADMALYRAKGDGRGTCRYFESSMDARLQQRRRLEIDLRRALAESEFVLHYQAQVVAQTSEIVGFEALVRWNHPTRGLVSPAEFIPLAEEIGLIVPLGEWILRRACADAAAWPKGVKVAVNLSPLQFKRQTLSHMVVSALAASGLPAHRLELEITETALLAETESTLATLHQLRTLGVRIAMDDFGTGYSSLSYLRSFPFDKIKIDRSFVRDLANSPDCVAIIKAVAGLGESLGMTTTAEGVETKEQLAMVSEQGCTEVQGYYFSAARPVQEIMAMLATAECARHEAAPRAFYRGDSREAAGF